MDIRQSTAYSSKSRMSSTNGESSGSKSKSSASYSAHNSDKYSEAAINAGERHSGHPSYRPIGPTSTANTSSYIPTPSNYKSDYERITGDDGTYMSSAPVLGRDGKNVFPKSKLDESKFNYETVRSGAAIQLPGELYHMSDPNPRAGIAFSSKNTGDTRSHSSSKQNRTRIATATTVRERGPKNDGFTMAEWSSVMNRLSGININPGDAINLDSGKSVVMGITDQHGDRVFTIAQEERGRDASTMVSFRSKDK